MSESGACIVLNGKKCAQIPYSYENCLNRFRADCKQLKNLIEEAAEEIENCYGRETELTAKLRAAL